MTRPQLENFIVQLQTGLLQARIQSGNFSTVENENLARGIRHLNWEKLSRTKSDENSMTMQQLSLGGGTGRLLRSMSIVLCGRL